MKYKSMIKKVWTWTIQMKKKSKGAKIKGKKVVCKSLFFVKLYTIITRSKEVGENMRFSKFAIINRVETIRPFLSDHSGAPFSFC